MNIVKTLASYLKSRTVWTIIAMVVLNGVPATSEAIPVSWMPYINILLGLIATYFRVNIRANLK